MTHIYVYVTLVMHSIKLANNLDSIINKLFSILYYFNFIYLLTSNLVI